MTPSAVRADEILVGRVLTLDDAGTQAEAMAVAAGRVLAVGSRQAMHALCGPGTMVRDFGSSTLIPGFNDTHAHMDSVGLKTIRPSLEGATCIADVLARIKALTATVPKGEWIVTMPVGSPPFFFNGPGTLAEGRLPDRHELDSVAPDHPVYIASPNGYWGEPPCHGTMNSLALQRNGITKHTKAQAPGTEVVLGPDGEPNGQVIERTYFSLIEADILPAIPRWDYAQRKEAVQRGMRLYAANGTTSVYEGHGVAPEVLAAYREVWQRGDMLVRCGMVVSPRWRNLEEADRAMRDWLPMARGRGFGDDMLRLSGVFIAHGGPPCVSLIQHKELTYVGWAGLVQTANSTEDFEALCRIAGKYDLRVHTIVSDKLDQMVPALQRLASEFPIGERRWVLEHVSKSSPQDLEAVRRMGVPVTLIPAQYLWKHGTPFMKLSEEQLDHLSPAKQLHELGVPVSAGTDAAPHNQLFVMWAMTERRERVTGRVMGERGKVSNELALRLLTRNGAYLTFDEHVKGQLAPGFLADVAVLSGNPLDVQGEALTEIQCQATMVGGRWVHGDL